MNRTVKKLLQNENLIEQGLVNIENGMQDALADVASDVQDRRRSTWMGPEEARATLQDLDAESQREQFRQARDAVLQDVARIALAYHELMLIGSGGRGLEPLTERTKALLISLHNPLIQESLLLAVEDEYRADAREAFDELGHILWGWAEASAGDDTGHGSAYLRYAAREWEMAHADVVAQVFGPQGEA